MASTAGVLHSARCNGPSQQHSSCGLNPPAFHLNYTDLSLTTTPTGASDRGRQLLCGGFLQVLDSLLPQEVYILHSLETQVLACFGELLETKCLPQDSQVKYCFQRVPCWVGSPSVASHWVGNVQQSSFIRWRGYIQKRSHLDLQSCLPYTEWPQAHLQSLLPPPWPVIESFDYRGGPLLGIHWGCLGLVYWELGQIESRRCPLGGSSHPAPVSTLKDPVVCKPVLIVYVSHTNFLFY